MDASTPHAARLGAERSLVQIQSPRLGGSPLGKRAFGISEPAKRGSDGRRGTSLRYCRFVHDHHSAEDHAFFPELRATNPEIGPVVDRLEADHRRVSDLLDAVEAAANALSEGGTADTRRELVDVLHALGESLLEHLNYEERNVRSTVLRLREGSAI